MDACASSAPDARVERAAKLYLTELARRLARIDQEVEPLSHLRSSLGRRLRPNSAPRLDRLRFRLAELVLPYDFVPARVVDQQARLTGRDYPQSAATMIGLTRLANLRDLVATVLRDDVPGDLIETGVWRGGASLYMRCALAAFGDQSRRVLLADSFSGLPKPGLAGHSQDALDLSGIEYLEASRAEVEALFREFGVLDSQVEFVEGWFHETLPRLRGRRFSVIRLDGDLYSSTLLALENLYPGLSERGFLIVDDDGIPECRQAVHVYREANGIVDEIVQIDESSVYWRRSG